MISVHFKFLSEARMLLAPVKPSGPLLHHTITNRSSVQQTITRSALLGATISVVQHAIANETANRTFLW